MQWYHDPHRHKTPGLRDKLKQQLVYLPGALLLIYGAWLTLSVGISSA